MQIIFLIIGFLILGVGGYYVACHIIKLWFGCNDNEASMKLHNFLNGKIQYQFYNDIGFANDVWGNVKNIIGDKRFEQLVKLSNTAISTPLLSFGENGGLPSIAVSLYYQDANEKLVLENIITNLVKYYLKIYGYNEEILVDWKVRYDLNMPFLQIRYARTQEEKRLLDIGIRNNQQVIVSKNCVITDDTETEELDG